MTLGRLQYTTGDITGAVSFFLGLLKGSVFVQGVPHEGDRVFLEDFRLAYEVRVHQRHPLACTK